jgi:hypothetical protein
MNQQRLLRWLGVVVLLAASQGIAGEQEALRGRPVVDEPVSNVFREGRFKLFRYETKDGWVATGIRVKKGQQIAIECTGKWSPDGGNTRTDPNGALRVDWEAVSFLPKVAHGKFLVYLSNEPEKYIEAGSRVTFVAGADGEIYIGLNDRNAVDNKGTLSVKITY